MPGTPCLPRPVIELQAYALSLRLPLPVHADNMAVAPAERLGVQLCEGAPAVQAAGHKREPAGSTPGGSMLSPIRMRAASPAGSSGAMHTRPRPG